MGTWTLICQMSQLGLVSLALSPAISTYQVGARLAALAHPRTGVVQGCFPPCGGGTLGGCCHPCSNLTRALPGRVFLPVVRRRLSSLIYSNPSTDLDLC